VSRNGTMQPFTFTVPSEIADRFRSEARRQGRYASLVFTDWVRQTWPDYVADCLKADLQERVIDIRPASASKRRGRSRTASLAATQQEIAQ